MAQKYSCMGVLLSHMQSAKYHLFMRKFQYTVRR